MRQSGLGAVHHGRISKIGRNHARAMLAEVAWAVARTPGPLYAFFVRIRARRGHQVAAVARKLAVLCRHMLTKEEDYLWARPALVANKLRAMELPAGRPHRKGNRRGPAYAYNVKALRVREIDLARQAERSYEHFVGHWRPRRPLDAIAGGAKLSSRATPARAMCRRLWRSHAGSLVGHDIAAGVHGPLEPAGTASEFHRAGTATARLNVPRVPARDQMELIAGV